MQQPGLGVDEELAVGDATQRGVAVGKAFWRPAREPQHLGAGDGTDSTHVAWLSALAEEDVDGNRHRNAHLGWFGSTAQQVEQRVGAALVHRANVIGPHCTCESVDGVVDLAGLDAGQERRQLGHAVWQRRHHHPARLDSAGTADLGHARVGGDDASTQPAAHLRARTSGRILGGLVSKHTNGRL